LIQLTSAIGHYGLLAKSDAATRGAACLRSRPRQSIGCCQCAGASALASGSL